MLYTRSLAFVTRAPVSWKKSSGGSVSFFCSERAWRKLIRVSMCPQCRQRHTLPTRTAKLQNGDSCWIALSKNSTKTLFFSSHLNSAYLWTQLTISKMQSNPESLRRPSSNFKNFKSTSSCKEPLAKAKCTQSYANFQNSKKTLRGTRRHSRRRNWQSLRMKKDTIFPAKKFKSLRVCLPNTSD